MAIRRTPAQQSSVMLADRDAQNFPERHKLPSLRDRFQVEVAPGVDDLEAMSARSRVLAVWVLESWREDRKAGVTSKSLLESSEQLFQTSRDELN